MVSISRGLSTLREGDVYRRLIVAIKRVSDHGGNCRHCQKELQNFFLPRYADRPLRYGPPQTENIKTLHQFEKTPELN